MKNSWENLLDINSNTQNLESSLGDMATVVGIKKIEDNVDIGDISAGIQSNDVKITLDSEAVDINDISSGTQTNDLKVTMDGEDIDVNDISKGIQTNDIKITLDGEQIVLASPTNVYAASGLVDINDISAGTQTNDLKITLDSEQVVIDDISAGTQTNDIKITLDSEQIDIADISKGTQTNDIKVTLDSEQINIDDISAGTQTNDVKVTLDSETVVLASPSYVKKDAARLSAQMFNAEVIDSNTNTTSATVFDAEEYSKGWVMLDFSKNGTPTELEVYILQSHNNSNFARLKDISPVNWTDIEYTGEGNSCLSVPLTARYTKIQAVSTGCTSGTNYFTFSAWISAIR